MSGLLSNPYVRNFLGNSPDWYKVAIVGFLVINPFVLWLMGPTYMGWLLMAEFIFTLAMALKCYPLQPGGLLALEAVIMGLTTTFCLDRYSATAIAGDDDRGAAAWLY